MNKEMVTYIETFIDFANKHFTEDREVDIAASRLTDYLNRFAINQKHATE